MTYLLQFWVFIEEHKNTNLEKYIHSMFTAAFFALASIQKEPAAAAAAAAKSLQSCPTLCDPIDSSPPGSPIPGILQARILEWVAISFSEKQPNDPLINERIKKMCVCVCVCVETGNLRNSGLSPGLPHCRHILYHLSHQESLIKPCCCCC